MALSYAQFEKHLAQGPLAPVYLVAGEEHLLGIEAADLVRAAARNQGYAERDVLDAGESGFAWSRLAEAGSAMSLFAQRRVVDLRIPTGKPGTEGADAIKRYCAALPPDTLLLITASTWSKQHETQWVAAVGDVGRLFIAWPLKGNELTDFVARRAMQRKLELAPDAIDVLIERTEGNLLAAAQEIDKLALLATGPAGSPGSGPTGARRLDAATLESLVADSARYDVFKLVDAALGGDTARALHIVDSLRIEGEAVPGLIGWITMQLQVMVRLGSAVDSGANPAMAMKQERVWASRENLYRNALVRGRGRYWEERLAHAARIERIGKGRLQGDAWRELSRLVASMADAKFAEAAR